MLWWPEPSARRPFGAPGSLGEVFGPRVPILDAALLGAGEDRDGGPVAGRNEHGDRLVDELR
eukprot:14953219-Alexandrium_andersonii.AAC.1